MQTVQTKIRLHIWEQSDQDLQCLPFHQVLGKQLHTIRNSGKKTKQSKVFKILGIYGNIANIE